MSRNESSLLVIAALLLLLAASTLWKRWSRSRAAQTATPTLPPPSAQTEPHYRKAAALPLMDAAYYLWRTAKNDLDRNELPRPAENRDVSTTEKLGVVVREVMHKIEEERRTAHDGPTFVRLRRIRTRVTPTRKPRSARRSSSTAIASSTSSTLVVSIIPPMWTPRSMRHAARLQGFWIKRIAMRIIRSSSPCADRHPANSLTAATCPALNPSLSRRDQRAATSAARGSFS